MVRLGNLFISAFCTRGALEESPGRLLLLSFGWSPHSAAWWWQVRSKLEHLLVSEVEVVAEVGDELSIQDVLHPMAKSAMA